MRKILLILLLIGFSAVPNMMIAVTPQHCAPMGPLACTESPHCFWSFVHSRCFTVEPAPPCGYLGSLACIESPDCFWCPVHSRCFLVVEDPSTDSSTDTPVDGVIEIRPPIRHETFAELIGAFINIIFTIALVLAPLMIIVGAFYFLIPSEKGTNIETGKKIILYTLIGFIIIMLANGIIELLKYVFEVRE